MKFGVSTFITDQGISPTSLGTALEDRAFDSLFIAEHTHIPADRQTPYPGGGELPEMYYRTLAPFVALTAIGVVTERMLLGTGIALIPQRDPIMTAKEVASLDLISGGRVIFGVGVGWNREEMRNHGTDPSTRGRLTDERLRAIRELWTAEKAEFHGEFVNFDPVYAWPKPVQRPIRRSTSAAARARSTGWRSSETRGWPTACRRRSSVRRSSGCAPLPIERCR
ncbi:putative F420-dependent oxidoreductase [Streptomyces sp. V1I1]|nr:putative F420-dependent oxidoreductase [Streptomyces sp. V1I1]